jgi:hypothetical protein
MVPLDGEFNDRAMEVVDVIGLNDLLVETELGSGKGRRQREKGSRSFVMIFPTSLKGASIEKDNVLLLGSIG